MRHWNWLFAMLLLCGCSKVLVVRDIPPITVGHASFFPTIEAHTDATIMAGNRVDILLNGDQTYPAILSEIRRAKSTITFAEYIYEDGALAQEVAEAFAERCRAGVAVHILLDQFGSSSVPSAVVDTMKNAGCHVEYFRRVNAAGIIFPWKLLSYNYRSHRRILVIDGRVGFTGGFGINEAWTGNGRTPEHWRDTNARIEGPAVEFLQAAFAESWLETTGVAIGGEAYFPRLEARGDVPAQIVKSSPTGGSFQSYMLFLLSISSAQKSILVTNPYFIPDQVMIEALVKAAARGVRVAILTQAKTDSEMARAVSRSHYGPLLLGGVEIFEYQVCLLHAKTMVVDGVWGTVGSTNFDNRSFVLNQELNLTVYDRTIAARFEEIFHEDLKYAKQISYEEWKSRGLYERFIDLITFPVKDQL
jgi:cardiolipin synthase A/B